MDEKTRELERQAATGDFDAEVRLLLHRMRGEPSPGLSWKERIGIAAFCGEKRAQKIAGVEEDPCGFCLRAIGFMHLPEECSGLEGWVKGLKQWPAQILMRAALAACLAHVSRCSTCKGTEESKRFRNDLPGLHAYQGVLAPVPCGRCFQDRRAIRAVAAWLASPSDETRDRCMQIGSTRSPSRLLPMYVGHNFDGTPGNTQNFVWHVVSECAHVSALGALDMGHALRINARPARNAEVHQAMREALIKWVLGA